MAHSPFGLFACGEKPAISGRSQAGAAPLSILIIDDHALFRSGVATLLSTAFGGVAVREGDALDGPDPPEPPDVVLLDVRLREADGLEGMARLQARWPRARFVVVSGAERADLAEEALRRGAAAFLSKTDRPERMIAVVRDLLPSGGGGSSLLTPRQQEVLELLGQGLSNKAVGRRLGVSENTVRGHVQATLAALGASSRAEAVFAARRLGLLR